jgi:hypothetical protein
MKEGLKGQCHEIFDFWFFHESVCPKPLSIPNGPFQIFSKIRGDIRSSKCTTGVVDTGGSFAAGVFDTGGNFPPASFTPAANLPPVSFIPVANLPPVLSIRAAILTCEYLCEFRKKSK